MALKGKEKEVKNFTKYVGMFNGNVVTVNPNKDELEKLLGATVEKDPEYTGMNDETGAKKLTLSFWLKEANEGHLFNVRFTLEDTVNVSKSGKTQFINSIGSTSYADDISSIPDFITSNNREVRKAKKGEELLYKFLRNWLSNLNYEDEGTELSLEWKKLINGNVKELKEAISSYENQTICAMATVRTAEDGKEYQGVYSYEFLPNYAMDCFTGRKGKNYKSVDRFIEKVTDVDYGCKDYYELKPLREYDPSKNIVGSTDSNIISQNTSKIETKSTEHTYVEAEVMDDDLPF